jgi:nicotinate-nucleotide adenylyltransferase
VKRKVGILGGSFDPPHNGHIAMARAAKDTLGLDTVLLMPAPQPPHKDPGDLSGWEDRWRMTQLATESVAGVEVSRHELDTPGPSFTIDAIRRYLELYDDDVYFILGADSLRDLPGWREPEAILGLVTVVVFPRDEIAPICTVPGDMSIVVFESPVIEVSSSEVRRKRRAGESVESMVPEAVLEYILDHSLYTS